MIEIDAKIDFDVSKLKGKTQADMLRRQKILDAMVLRDSNLFCPMDTGTLQRSAVIHTVIGSGQVEWHTPYAAQQYYNWRGGKDSRNRNPRATSKWFETAKARYLDKWLEAIGAEHS